VNQNINNLADHHKLVDSPFINTIPLSDYSLEIDSHKKHYLLIIIIEAIDQITNSFG
jgi:hypothetical protein